MTTETIYGRWVSEPLFGEDHSVQAVRTPIWRELLAGPEWWGLHLAPVYYGRGVPHGQGEPVMLVPGFLSADWQMGEMFTWLGRIGYAPHFSRLGWNIDCPNASFRALSQRVQRVALETGQRVRLVGHSLGGLLARSVALEHPESVAQVICLAAPFQDVAYVHPVLVAAMEVVRGHGGAPLTPNVRPTCYSGHCSCRFMEHMLAPSTFAVRRHAIYSRMDGLVAWQSCAEAEAEFNTEVMSSHMGMVANADAYEAIAHALAGAAGC